MFDGAQEFGIAQRRHEVAADRRKIVAQFDQIAHQGLEARGVDSGLALVLLEYVCLALEFLQHIAARIAASGDRENLEETGHRGARTPGTRVFAVIARLGIEKFEAKKGPHALIERLLI